MIYDPFNDPTSRQIALLHAIGVSRAERVPVAPIEYLDAANTNGVLAWTQRLVAT
jgi:hypothetical protein